MRNIIYKTVAASVLSLSMWGCSDDFLELEPYAKVDENAFYTSLTAAEQLVTGAYAPLTMMDIMDSRYMMSMGSIASDDAECGGLTIDGMPDAFDMDKMTLNPDNVCVNRVWGYMYKGIARCNLALQKFPEIAKIDTSENTKKTLAIRTGEMKFMRALYYSILSHVYGSVALVTEPLEPEAFKQENVPMKKVYEQMESDLLEAINLLPEKNATEVGRATKGAAKALLAKIYLYESSYRKNYGDDVPYNRFERMKERWADVVKYGEEVIASNKYQLMGANGERFKSFWSDTTGGYRYLFTVQADNCDEVIFTINYTNDAKGWGESRGNTLNWHSNVGYVYLKKDPTVSYQYAWNYHCPTKELIAEFELGDTRLKTTCALPGDTIYANVKSKWQWAVMDLDKTPTKSMCRKYEIGKDFSGGFFQGPQNMNLIRYADLLLMTAEAYIQLGKPSDIARATELINMVRTRARNSGYNGKPVDLSPGTATMEALIHERRVELALEGFRFFDLVRWRLAEKELLDAKSVHLETGFDCEFKSPRNDFYPIPAREITMSGNKLKQNPGW